MHVLVPCAPPPQREATGPSDRCNKDQKAGQGECLITMMPVRMMTMMMMGDFLWSKIVLIMT